MDIKNGLPFGKNIQGKLVVVNTVVSYTALIADDVILTTADITLYAGSEQTKLIAIKNIGNSSIDILPNGSETIENQIKLTVLNNNSFTLAFKNNNWSIV